MSVWMRSIFTFTALPKHKYVWVVPKPIEQVP